MLKILVIDDPELIRLLRNTVAERAECRILCARSPVELIDRARRERPEAVLLRRDPAGGPTARIREAFAEDRRLAGIPVLELDDRGAGAGDALAGLLGLEWRRRPRRPIALPVQWHRGERSGTARSKDLSAEGLFLKTREPFERQQTVPLIFRLPLPEEPMIRAEGEVVRIVRYERDSHLIPGVALRIRRISERDRRDLERFVAGGPEART